MVFVVLINELTNHPLYTNTIIKNIKIFLHVTFSNRQTFMRTYKQNQEKNMQVNIISVLMNNKRKNCKQQATRIR